MNREEILNMMILNRVTNYTPVQKFRLYERYKSASSIFSRRQEAESLSHKPFKINGEHLTLEGIRNSVQREMRFCDENDISILDIGYSSYPGVLKNIDDPPLLLYAQGRVDLLNQVNAVGVVGARKASNMSINLAYSIARDLARAEFIVVSGLASGIDFYSHKGALDGNGCTIAVLGNGIDIVYPKANRSMYEGIRKKGLLLSEFPIGTKPLKYNFPKRNRILSGLCLGTVIIEASAHSGALITADYALDQGREVMALPGKAGSESFEGNNRLIKEGAHLVENAADIVEILGFDFEYKGNKKKKLPFSLLEYNILKVIGDEKVSIEEMESILEDSVSKIASALTMLELKGAVIQYPGKIYSRVSGNGKR